jgi:hypothetical protein
MSEKGITTAWMWKSDDGEVWGLTLNRSKGKVEWSDSIGCACGDSFAEQTFADFLERGARFGEPPSDVLEEVYTSLKRLSEESPAP